MRFWPFKRKQRQTKIANVDDQAIAFRCDTLYISGAFTPSRITDTDYIAKWDGSMWSAPNAPKTSIVYAGDTHMLSWEETQTWTGNDIMAAPERHCYYCGVRVLSSLAKCPHCNGPQKIH